MGESGGLCGHRGGSGWGGAVGDTDDEGWGNGADAGGGEKVVQADFEGELAGGDGGICFSEGWQDGLFGDECGGGRFVVSGGDRPEEWDVDEVGVGSVGAGGFIEGGVFPSDG